MAGPNYQEAATTSPANREPSVSWAARWSYFKSSGGTYSLDVDVLFDTIVLNTGNPRLKVEADGPGYNRLSSLRGGLVVSCTILLVIGGALPLVSRARQNAELYVGLEISATPRIGHRRPSPYRAIAPLAPFSRLPPFGLLGVLAIPLAVSLMARPHNQPSVGIWIRTHGLSPAHALRDPTDKPLVLKIDQSNRWWLDGKRVSPRDFSGALKNSLKLRSDWVVYLDAHPDLDFGAAAQAIDMIQTLYAQVVLLTPGVKKTLGGR